MKIVGIGIDVIEVERIDEAVEEFGDRFLERIFTAEERALLRRPEAPGDPLCRALGGQGGGVEGLRHRDRGGVGLDRHRDRAPGLGGTGAGPPAGRAKEFAVRDGDAGGQDQPDPCQALRGGQCRGARGVGAPVRLREG